MESKFKFTIPCFHFITKFANNNMNLKKKIVKMQINSNKFKVKFTFAPQTSPDLCSEENH